MSDRVSVLCDAVREGRSDQVVELARKFVAFDWETWLIQPGVPAPPPVCGSVAYLNDELIPTAESIQTEIYLAEEALEIFYALLTDQDVVLVGANFVFDVMVSVVEFARRGRDILPEVWEAYDSGRIFDVQIAQQLHATGAGILGLDPRTLKRMSKGGRYSLADCVSHVLGREDAKRFDKWRLRYAELRDLPLDQWPDDARQYPQDDARNTLEVALAQMGVLPRVMKHAWVRDHRGAVHCGRCGAGYLEGGECLRGGEPSWNLHALGDQCGTHWALYLGACWGFKVDQAMVTDVLKETREKRGAHVAALRANGFLRPDGTKDTAAINRAVAEAYGAAETCEHCGGSGRIVSASGAKRKSPCRSCGVRPLEGQPGCDECGVRCPECSATGLIVKDVDSEVPLTATERVSASRDVLDESGDDRLMELAEWGRLAKTETNYGPYLQRAGEHRLILSPNPFLETDRVSYSDAIQQFPRGGRLRECIWASDGFVLASVDYTAGELVTDAQHCIWTVGFSDLADALNGGLDAHLLLASHMMGVTYEEFVGIYNNKSDPRHKLAKALRQAAKCFHPDTEILTRARGWVRVGDLSYDDEVAAAIPNESGIAIEWQQPTLLTRDRADELVHLRNEGMDLRVTPDHRMLVRTQSKKGGPAWKVVTPEEVPASRGWYNAGTWAGGDWSPDEALLRLAVATQADGSYSHDRVRFGFVKERKIARMRELLSASFPGRWREFVTENDQMSTGEVCWFVLEASLSAEVRTLLDEHKQFTWRWLELEPRLRDLVLAEVEHWDGHQPPGCTAHVYDTTQPRNVDVLQALAAVSGRKTRAVVNNPPDERRAAGLRLTIRAGDRTRGGNLSCERVAHGGEVVCLSVPSSFVVVRDGGVPVVVGQCGNFGFGGGMGVATMVWRQRMNGPDTPCPGGPAKIGEDDEGRPIMGYRGTRFCVMMRGAERCGLSKISEWNGRECPPICEVCAECSAEIRSAWFGKWREHEQVFRYVSDAVDCGQEADLEEGQVVQHDSRIVRGACKFTDAANGYFQSLLGRIAKRALRWAQRECTDVTRRIPRDQVVGAGGKVSAYGGMESPLLGSRIILFAHDENLPELLRSQYHDAATRLSELMVRSMIMACPDVERGAKAPPAVMPRWYKNAEPIHHGGKLVEWTPEHEKAKSKGTCPDCAAEAARNRAAA